MHYDYGTSSPSGLDRVRFTPGFDFSSWQALHFNAAEPANPFISSFTADPDNDGLTYGVEAMLGTNPRAHSGEPLAGVLDETGPGPEWVITFSIPKTAPIDVNSSIEISSDLDTDWTPYALGSLDIWTAVPPATLTDSPGASGFRDLTLRVPATSNRLYARFLVTQP